MATLKYQNENGTYSPIATNGVTPHIDPDTGNWFVGDVDTKVKAGTDVTIADNDTNFTITVSGTPTTIDKATNQVLCFDVVDINDGSDNNLSESLDNFEYIVVKTIKDDIKCHSQILCNDITPGDKFYLSDSEIITFSSNSDFSSSATVTGICGVRTADHTSSLAILNSILGV